MSDYDYDKAFNMVSCWDGGRVWVNMKYMCHYQQRIFGGCHVIILIDNLCQIIKVLFNVGKLIKVIIKFYNQPYLTNFTLTFVTMEGLDKSNNVIQNNFENRGDN